MKNNKQKKVQLIKFNSHCFYYYYYYYYCHQNNNNNNNNNNNSRGSSRINSSVFQKNI